MIHRKREHLVKKLTRHGPIDAFLNVCCVNQKNHVVSQHQITQDDYQKTHGRTMVHLEKHHCQIEDCKVIMLWDSNAIYGHLWRIHEKMSLKQYKEKYMDNYT